MLSWLFILGIGLLAGTLSGMIGFGGTTILLPVLTLAFGPKAAVPIMAIAAILGNLSRVMVWWREIAWAPAATYSVAAVPAAWLGAQTMWTLDPQVLELCLGSAFIGMIFVRRWLSARGFRIGFRCAGCAAGRSRFRCSISRLVTASDGDGEAIG